MDRHTDAVDDADAAVGTSAPGKPRVFFVSLSFFPSVFD